MQISSNVLVADCVCNSISVSSIVHSCSFALAVGSLANYPIEGYGDYINNISEELGIPVTEVSIHRQPNEQDCQDLISELSELPSSCLSDWYAFFTYLKDKDLTTLWGKACLFELKSVVTPKEFLDILRKYTEKRYTLSNISIDEQIVAEVNAVIWDIASLNEIPTHIVKSLKHRLVLYNYILDCLELYNKVKAVEHISPLGAFTEMFPKLVSFLVL
jgi:hypothetical protein